MNNHIALLSIGQLVEEIRRHQSNKAASYSTVAAACRDGNIEGAQQVFGRLWVAPLDAALAWNEGRPGKGGRPPKKGKDIKLRINQSYHDMFPNNCPLIEVDSDGKEVWTCTYYAPDGVCPCHGNWREAGRPLRKQEEQEERKE